MTRRAVLLSVVVMTILVIPLLEPQAHSSPPKAVSIELWDPMFSDLVSYTKQTVNLSIDVSVRYTPPGLDVYKQVSSGQTPLALGRLSTFLRISKRARAPLELLAVTDVLNLHVLGNTFGPDNVNSGYSKAFVATLEGTSAADATALLDAIGNGGSCVNPVSNCKLLAENDPDLADKFSSFLQEGEKNREPRLVIITAREKTAERNRNPIVQAVSSLPFAKLVSISQDVIDKMGQDYGAAAIDAGVYRNAKAIPTAQDIVTLASRPGWRSKDETTVMYVDTLNKTIFDPKFQRFDLKNLGPGVARQLLTVTQRSNGLITLDSRLRDRLSAFK